MPRESARAGRSQSPHSKSPPSQRIGNHTLLKKSENAKIGNKPWKVKKPVLAASTLKLTKDASKPADWTPASIATRQKALAKLAVKTWARDPPA